MRVAWVSLLILMPLTAASADIKIPIIESEWWQVAGDPDLGQYTDPKQQPVDFAVWQAADGTWQLWSCIRHTTCGGHTRLFHRWEGQRLTNTDWEPKGIAMMADPGLGEPLGGLQAPHVVQWQGRYWMAYGDWDDICFATSEDGKEFTRIIQPDGETAVFTEGPGVNTRDAMLLFMDGLWYCYYTAFPNGRGYDYCRTSPDMKTWSHSSVVAYGGWAGNNPFSAECPHVVEVDPGEYYLFRTQRYGEDGQTSVYRSENPLNFGIDDDSYFVTSMPVAAPEIVLYEGQYYMASLLPSLKGIRIAKLNWISVETVGTPVFDFDDADARDEWTVIDGDIDPVFTQSTRQDFAAPMDWFIGTAEIAEGGYEDARTCVVESPAFTIADAPYAIYVSGGARDATLHVAVADSATGEEFLRMTGRTSNRLERRIVDLSEFAGRKAVVRVVDRDSEPWGHINFGGMFALTGPANAD